MGALSRLQEQIKYNKSRGWRTDNLEAVEIELVNLVRVMNASRAYFLSRCFS